MKKTAENDFDKAVECIVKSDFYNDLNKCLDMVKLLDKNKELQERINKGIEAINVYQNEKTLSVGYQDLKRIRGILQGNEFDLQMFEKYLQELKVGEKSE